MSIAGHRYETSVNLTVNLSNVATTMTVDDLVRFKWGVEYPFPAKLTRASDSAVEYVLCTADDGVSVVTITRAQEGTTALAINVGDDIVRQAMAASGAGTVTNVTASAPLASSGGATPNLSLTGTVPIGNGGTGQATQQLGMDALAGAVTSGDFLRGNGTHVIMDTIHAGDIPSGKSIVQASTLWDLQVNGDGSCVADDDVADTLIAATSKPGSPQYTRTILAGDIPSNAAISDVQLWLSIGGKNTDSSTRTINWIVTVNGTEMGSSASLSPTTVSPFWHAWINVATLSLAAGDVIGVKMWASVTNVVDYRFATHYYLPRHFKGASDTTAIQSMPFYVSGLVTGAISGVSYQLSALAGAAQMAIVESGLVQTLAAATVGATTFYPNYFTYMSSIAGTDTNNYASGSAISAAAQLNKITSAPRYLRRVTLST